ncbi:hypothetical protein [Acinetobacter bereziniae]|uniref:hypothetical protein n=1 Tax=Acinetobacter bereziniae TaxID=106648 RepID=UPI0018FF4999|nr:hypothetical protein [Acinetobacter bereziniae]MBJ9902054.1 hypothetical protein [Acinetobacter bereziniae]MCU4317923.1 hypothetical protein [Acinetobacter bereziniae]MCU4597737.1 hypothetical protein [Acinetobacter bereziniae]
MDKFEDAFKKISKVNLATHIELWGEPKTEKLYFEAGQQSRQAEINQLQSQINEMAEVGLSQESELNKKDEHAHNLFYENANLQALVEEKDKRIEELENLMKMQECGANKIYEIALKGVRKTGGDYYLEKIIDLLRGEHE